MPVGALAEVQRLAQDVRRASWFAAVGQALTDGERQDAEAYAAALGFSGAPVAVVPDWRAAEAATRDAGWDARWWESEEKARADLLSAARARHGERATMTALSEVALAASDTVMGVASVAAARMGVADPALARVAAGAATQAAYQAALALAAEAGADHAFAVKYRLFAAGRWPLGIVGGALSVF